MSTETSGGHEYGSHFIPLTFAALNSTGPILELGAGHYSPPLLHVICMNEKRKLLTTDTSKKWLDEFRSLETEWHQFQYIPVYEDDWEKNPKPDKWDEIMAYSEKWGLVFVDHRPGGRRIFEIEKYKDEAEFIVVHDTQEPGYNYEPSLSKFKFRLDYKRFETWTSIVSNFKDISTCIF